MPASKPTLVGGVGLPWLRDLDLGTRLVERMQALDWADDVIVEDLSYAAHRVLHRFWEILPRRAILVGAMPRNGAVPGTIRRYRLDLTPPSGEEVHARLGESVGGIIDLDHTLAVLRYWHAFPPDTVVIEVEPEDSSFGLGLSPAVEASVEAVLTMVRHETERVDPL